MRVRRWAAIWLVTMLVTTALGTAVRAQYTEGLPQGVQQVTVDGQPIDASNTPETDNRTPQIAGRLEAGPGSIEIAIANGDVVRFTLDVDERGRFKGTPPDELRPGNYSLYLSDALVGQFVVTGGGGAEGTPRARGGGGKLLDLAEAVPFPEDVADALAGLGLVPDVSRYLTVADRAQQIAAQGGDTSREAVDQAQQNLEAAGFRQQYNSSLAIPSADDPTVFEVQVSTSVIEYAAVENAQDAYAASTGGGEAVEAQTIGDESEIVSQSGVASQSGAAFQALRLVFRQDRLLIVITYADLQNRQPDQAAIEAMGEAAQRRAAAVLDGSVIGLGAQALRLDLSQASGRTTDQEAYLAIAGTVIPYYGESQDDVAVRQDRYAGATDVYGATFAARGGGGGRNATPTAGAPGAFSYTTTLYGFGSEDEASQWLAGLDQRLQQDPLPGYLTFARVDDAQTYGDESATYSFQRRSGDQTASGFRVYVRVGAVVASVELSAVPDVDQDSLAELVNAQADCLQKQSCPKAAPLPSGLGGPAPSAQNEGGGQAEQGEQGGQGRGEGRGQGGQGGGGRGGRRGTPEATEAAG